MVPAQNGAFSGYGYRLLQNTNKKSHAGSRTLPVSATREHRFAAAIETIFCYYYCIFTAYYEKFTPVGFKCGLQPGRATADLKATIYDVSVVINLIEKLTTFADARVVWMTSLLSVSSNMRWRLSRVHSRRTELNWTQVLDDFWTRVFQWECLQQTNWTHFDSSINHLQNAINRISSWMTANLLTLDSSKIEFLLIGLRKQLAKIHNSSLNITHSAQNLGFIFDERLTFSGQTSSVSKSCYFHIRQLRVSAYTSIPKQLPPSPLPLFTPSSTTATLFITTCPSVRSPGFNRSRTLLHVLLSKLPNPVTSLPSSGLCTGSK